MIALRVLAVDDELPALNELAFLLRADPRVQSVRTAVDGPTALRELRDEAVDAVFVDIHMPGLTGLELADLLGRFRTQPAVVFVTAHDEHAVEAFDLHAVDYVLKPVRAERLSEAVRRVVAALHRPAASTRADAKQDDSIPVELGGVTRFVSRRDVRFVEAQGDYARLHTADGSHLVRIPLTALEEQWADAGFVRIHRSHLVALAHVDEIRMDGGRCTVRIGDDYLPVSRRHTRELRDLLVRQVRPSRPDGR